MSLPHDTSQSRSLDDILETAEIGTRVIIDDYTTTHDHRHIVNQVGIIIMNNGPVNSIELAEAMDAGAYLARSFSVVLLGETTGTRIPNIYCHRLNAKKFKEYLNEHDIDEEWANAWCKQIYRMIGK